MWVSVVKLSELKKPLHLVGVGDLSIVLVSMGEQIYALEELCPHRAGPLSEGYISGNKVVCPWHAAAFEVPSGKCLRGPAARDLKAFPLKVENGEIKLEIPKE